jgi:hypothetical protein
MYGGTFVLGAGELVEGGVPPQLASAITSHKNLFVIIRPTTIAA